MQICRSVIYALVTYGNLAKQVACSTTVNVAVNKLGDELPTAVVRPHPYMLNNILASIIRLPRGIGCTFVAKIIAFNVLTRAISLTNVNA